MRNRQRFAVCTVCCGLILAGVASGHWADHPDLPAWARRGRIHWALNYGRTDRQLVDLFLKHHQNFLHGGRFQDAETARYAFAHGLRYMPYVCSRTLRTYEMEKNRQLKQAVVLRADGSEYPAYNNPVRRYGCLHAPAWPEYVRNRVRRVWDLPDVAAIFFDNAMWPVDDHNPANVKAWQQWAKQHGIAPGDDVPSIYEGPLAPASRMFSLDSLTAYHAMLQKFCHRHTPPLLNCPNAGNAYGLAVAERGAIDLFFYETMSHPPFVHNADRYKIGLAVTHGRPVALLAYLPPDIAAERGVRTWSEVMHHYFYPASPLPDEFALAAAEGAACGGTYVVNYNLFPSLPITDLTDPFCKRVHRAIERMYSFIAANEEVYAGTRPGSDVALLYSPITNIQNRHLQNMHGLSEALIAAGIPFEIVVPTDLHAPARLAGVHTLVVPGVAFTTAESAAGLFSFIESGGRVIITGDFAIYDPIGRPAHFPAAERIRNSLGIVNRPIRAWRLDGFEPEGTDHVRVRAKAGTARLHYDGPSGKCIAWINITDENDGTSTVRLSVGGRPVYTRRLDIEDDRRHWFHTSPFEIRTGDEIALRVDADAGERGRVYSVILAAADSARGARIGKGSVMFSPEPLDAASPARLMELLRPSIRLPHPGKTFLNIMDVPELRLRTLHLVNYDFRYSVQHPGRYASDDGKQDARMFFGGQPVVVRKRIHIPAPDAVATPVIVFRGFATRECDGRLVFTVNGRRAGSIEAAAMRRSDWHEIPIDRRFLTKETTIEVRAEGNLDGMKRWIQIGIDADTHAGDSWFSTDGGRTFSSADLSPDRKNQTGEYMIRIIDQNPGGVPADPANLVRNPGFEQVRVPHSETALTIVPARDLTIEARAGALPPLCLAVSPDQPPRRLPVTSTGSGVRVRVPSVRIYTMLLFSNDPERLDALRKAQLAAAPWTLPPVTEPLRRIVPPWRAYGKGYVIDTRIAHSGSASIRCDNADDASAVRGALQTFAFEKDPPRRLIITAWSRARNVSGRPDANYSVYVDAVCIDGTTYNGRNAPFRCGSHDWETATLKIEAPKALRSLRLHLLFRRHAGTAWFDDVSMKRLQ